VLYWPVSCVVINRSAHASYSVAHFGSELRLCHEVEAACPKICMFCFTEVTFL
jgi:hypothetical protein